LTREFLRVHLGACEREIFGVLHLDSRHRLIAVENLFRGTINSASVHPREVVNVNRRRGLTSVRRPMLTMGGCSNLQILIEKCR
jgi:DNA repair protein RadC